jgi:hypothetical protein
VNKVDSGIAVNLLSGSRIPVTLPGTVEVVGVGEIGTATTAPGLEPVPFRKTTLGYAFDLKDVRQDPYNTIIFLKP